MASIRYLSSVAYAAGTATVSLMGAFFTSWSNIGLSSTMEDGQGEGRDARDGNETTSPQPSHYGELGSGGEGQARSAASDAGMARVDVISEKDLSRGQRKVADTIACARHFSSQRLYLANVCLVSSLSQEPSPKERPTRSNSAPRLNFDLSSHLDSEPRGRPRNIVTGKLFSSGRSCT